MQQLLSVWVTLDPLKRVIAVLATLAMFAAALTLSRVAAAPGLSLLYAGLESGAAGDVVAALEQKGEVYEVRGGAIYVNSVRRDELRMTLASEGLPSTSGSGYELLESLSGFGTTSQMFDAAYWRAKEGELARTILASPRIRSARVHISSVSSQPFKREIKPTASVSITTMGSPLTAAQAKALKYLISSAVADLSPSEVAVIDGDGRLVSSADDSATNEGSGDERANSLKRRVERLMEARVGPGKAVVEVSVQTVTESESIVERRIDPESRIVISTDTEERTNSSKDSGANAVTVASNLPTGDADASKSSASSQNSETRERVNFEVSETKRELVRMPGSIKRLTVAVLVDGTFETDPSGSKTWVPRKEEELSALRELVSSAVGFDESRGDVITLKSLAFQPDSEFGTLATTSFLDGLHFDLMGALQLAVLALVALVLGLFVVRPILSAKSTAFRNEARNTPISGGTRRIADDNMTSLSGEIADNSILPASLQDVSPRQIGMPDAPRSKPANGAPQITDPVARLKQLIEDRQVESVEILRGWMEEKEERA